MNKTETLMPPVHPGEIGMFQDLLRRVGFAGLRRLQRAKLPRRNNSSREWEPSPHAFVNLLQSIKHRGEDRL